MARWPEARQRERMTALVAGHQATSAAASGEGAKDDKRQARNLTAFFSRAQRRSCRLGYGDANSLYARLLREVNPMVLPSASHLFCDQFTRSSKMIKTCTARNAFKLRHGNFWNAKLARRFQKPYLGKTSDGKCPLCENPDSGTHVLGACTHRLVTGSYIERHKEAVAFMGKAMMEGAKGGCLKVLVADAGWHGKVIGCIGLCAKSWISQVCRVFHRTRFAACALTCCF